MNPISYLYFISTLPEFHPICSYPWLQTYELISAMYSNGFGRTNSDWLVTSAQYGLLIDLCQQSELLSFLIREQFAFNEVLSVETLSTKVLEEQMASAKKVFSEQYKVTFDSTLAFIIDTFRSNQFQDRYMSSWQATFSNATENYIVRAVPLSFNDGTCTCAAGMSNCSRPLMLTDSGNNQRTLPGEVYPLYLIGILIDVFSGFFGGCSVFDGLRQSTFECLFDQECVDDLRAMLSVANPILALNSSMLALFVLPTASIGSILDRMFIQSWVHRLNYSAYFLACAPAMCRYSYVGSSDAVYILTTLLKLYGGLEVVSKLVVWYGVCLILATLLCRRQRRQAAPFVSAH